MSHKVWFILWTRLVSEFMKVQMPVMTNSVEHSPWEAAVMQLV